MLAHARGEPRKARVSRLRSGNVAQYTVEKLIELGARPLTLSDSDGFVHDPDGINAEKLAYVMELKNLRRGRIREYADRFHGATFTPAKDEGPTALAIAADCAFPSATQNEISGVDARNLVANGVKLVAEGRDMPTTPEGVDRFLEAKVSYGPGKAATQAAWRFRPEMTQDIEHLSWTREQVDAKFAADHARDPHKRARGSRGVRQAGRLRLGSQYRSFVKVADAMVDESTV